MYEVSTPLVKGPLFYHGSSACETYKPFNSVVQIVVIFNTRSVFSNCRTSGPRCTNAQNEINDDVVQCFLKNCCE